MRGNAIARAVALAARAHRDQVDQAGVPYILHPMRVMFRAAYAGMRLEAVIAAVLHDVVEDTAVTAAEVGREFGPDVGRLLDLLTRRKRDGETYASYIVRCATDWESAQIKRYDVEDNLSRLGNLEPEVARRFASRYTAALAVLKGDA